MYIEKLKLDGRVAVVTGGGQGIGAACARALGEAGATLVIADLQEDRGQACAAELTRLGTTILADAADDDGNVNSTPVTSRTADPPPCRPASAPFGLPTPTEDHA